MNPIEPTRWKSLSLCLLHRCKHIVHPWYSVGFGWATRGQQTRNFLTSSFFHPPLPLFSVSNHRTPPKSPPSNSVVRGISPLTQTVPSAIAWPSLLVTTRPPAFSIESNVGSAGSRPITCLYSGGGAMPRAIGRLGCRSIVQDVDDGPRRAKKDRRPPEWSECQWDRMTSSILSTGMSRDRMLRARERESGPVSNNVRCSFEPLICVS